MQAGKGIKVVAAHKLIDGMQAEILGVEAIEHFTFRRNHGVVSFQRVHTEDFHIIN